MNISNYISESLETIRWVNIPKFFYADPDLGSKIFLTLNPRFGMEKFGCGKNIPDPQHCIFKISYLPSKKIKIMVLQLSCASYSAHF
jgi:hypothetical protein